MPAIYGYSFCKAARQAFKLLASNAIRVFAINSIGDFVLFLAKAAIIVSTIFIGIEFMKVKHNFDPVKIILDLPNIRLTLIQLNPNRVTYTWFPVLLGALIALLISHTFISIFEVSITFEFTSCHCSYASKRLQNKNKKLWSFTSVTDDRGYSVLVFLWGLWKERRGRAALLHERGPHGKFSLEKLLLTSSWTTVRQ